jgi:hypothetical protein
MPMSSPDANIELVRTSFEAFNANDIDSCLAVLAPDFDMHLAELPEPLHGPDIWQEGVELIKGAFPDLHVHIEDIHRRRGSRRGALDSQRHTHRRVPRLPPDRAGSQVRQPRVLSRRRWPHRRGMDLLGHREPLPTTQLNLRRRHTAVHHRSAYGVLCAGCPDTAFRNDAVGLRRAVHAQEHQGRSRGHRP